jgi:hypothetical protein
VVSVLGTLDPEGLRAMGALLAWLRAQLGRQTRAIYQHQRQLARHLSPSVRTVIHKAVARDLETLGRTRMLYRSTFHLIQRLAPPRQDRMITREARQLSDRVTRAGLSKRQAYRLIATVLRHWHGLPEAALTPAQIRGRLQVRPKPSR